jgi:hypothetical protein
MRRPKSPMRLSSRGGWAGQFGDLPAGLDASRIARRAVPEVAFMH